MTMSPLLRKLRGDVAALPPRASWQQIALAWLGAAGARSGVVLIGPPLPSRASSGEDGFGLNPANIPLALSRTFPAISRASSGKRISRRSANARAWACPSRAAA